MRENKYQSTHLISNTYHLVESSLNTAKERIDEQDPDSLPLNCEPSQVMLSHILPHS